MVRRVQSLWFTVEGFGLWVSSLDRKVEILSLLNGETSFKQQPPECRDLSSEPIQDEGLALRVCQLALAIPLGGSSIRSSRWAIRECLEVLIAPRVIPACKLSAVKQHHEPKHVNPLHVIPDQAECF